nr:hypothetical protein [Bacilli bacterium]
MKDKKKLYIVSGIIAFIVIAIIFVLFINDKNKLTRSEKNWINDNMNVVQNIHVVNNVNVFGDNGTGVFYDFIQDLQTEYRLEINPVTFLYGETATGNAFNAGPVIGKDATVFYEDHYAIVGKDKAIHTSSSDFIQSEIGVLALDSEYLKMVLPNYNFKVYESTDKLFEGLKNGDVSLIMISVLRDIDKVIENDFYVNYHFSDVKYYYYFDGAENNELASIVKKYFNNWKDKYFTEVFNSNEFVTITNALGLSEADISDILAKTYNYGFINQNPYEVITGGNFGGISAVYLKEFSKFSGVDFKFNKYSSFSKFIDAIGKQDIDIYLNFYTFDDKFQTTYTPQGINFDIIAPVKEKITIGSLNTPNEITVYTQKSSKIASYLANNSNYKIEYFETLKEMNRLAKKGKIIALDTEVFNYFHKNKLRNYESRLHMSINESYSFKTNTNNKFDKLLSAYISTLDPNIIKYTGIYNHNQTVLKGEILAKIAQYILLILSLLGLFMALFY